MIHLHNYTNTEHFFLEPHFLNPKNLLYSPASVAGKKTSGPRSGVHRTRCLLSSYNLQEVYWDRLPACYAGRQAEYNLQHKYWVRTVYKMFIGIAERWLRQYNLQEVYWVRTTPNLAIYNFII